MKKNKQIYTKSLLLIISFLLVVVIMSGCDGTTGDPIDTASTYRLTISSIIGQGTIEPPVGNHDFEEDAIVNLKVTPDAGWEFSEWTGTNASDVLAVDAANGEYKIQMNSNKSIRPVFQEIAITDAVELFIDIEGEGVVELDRNIVERNEIIQLTVIPDAGNSFTEWLGPNGSEVEPVQGTDDKWQILMDDNKEIKALFSPITEMEIIYVNSNITTPTTWETNSIYVIERSNLTVSSLLTIEPGVIVKFQDNNRMTISSSGGGLLAEGTAARPIIFTSYKDDKHGGDTNQDGSFTSPAVGDWEYIRIDGTAIINHTHFYYGGSNWEDATLIINGTTSVRNSTFANNNGLNYGTIDARQGATIENNIFHNNVKPIRLNSSLSIDDSNTFHNPDNPAEKNTFQGIFINGRNIVRNTIWEETEVGFVFDTRTTVSAESKLTIGEGVILKFNETHLSINGILDAVGSEENPIIFTSYKDDRYGGDSNGDGNFTSPAPEDWEYLKINGSAKIEYSRFYFGGRSWEDATLIIDGTTNLENSTFAFNNGVNYGTLDARSGATIKNNIFYGNTKPMRLNVLLSIDDSNIFHNPNNPAEKNRFQGIFINGSSMVSNVTWEETEVAFVISSTNFYVRENHNLTLGDNVVLKFTSGSTLNHYNNLFNYDGPGVYFTSYLDDSRGGDSNGDEDSTTPSIGDWRGIRNSAASPSYYETWSNILYAE